MRVAPGRPRDQASSLRLGPTSIRGLLPQTRAPFQMPLSSPWTSPLWLGSSPRGLSSQPDCLVVLGLT